MTEAILSRDGTSVTITLGPADGEGMSNAIDVGKPRSDMSDAGTVDPRSIDHWGGFKTITLNGYFDGDTAYSDAQTLAEDLIKPYSDGNDLVFDATSLPEFDETVLVAPTNQRACVLTYEPGGVTNMVGVELSLPMVSNTLG